MTNIAINVRVCCSDGECGKSTNVILNPVSHKVTHVAIEDKSLPDYSTRLVPVSKVISATQEQINLSCTRAELVYMDPFIVTNLVRVPVPEMEYGPGDVYAFPYSVYDTTYLTVQDRNISSEALAVYCGMQIKSTDGNVGRLDELVLDPQSGEITHLLMREGHLWGKKEVTIPVSAIDFVDDRVIHLKLDKAAVKDLPAIPVKKA
jgi:sporulation protein YlmC with PRC-barrel domain